MVLKRSVQIPFFRIWYSSAFIVLFLITFVLTLVSPADLIYQATKNSSRSIANIISVATVYTAAAALCFLIWASRVYTNRAVLRDIPKHYLPIDAGEVPRKVRRLIERQWVRTALVAWDSRPRDVSLDVRAEEAATAAATAIAAAAPNVAAGSVADVDVPDGGLPTRTAERRFRRRDRARNCTTVLSAGVALKAWGRIAHSGWSTPNAAAGQPESVQYTSVIVELPHLLEAKAVSLAPAQAVHSHNDDIFYATTEDAAEDAQPALPDPRVVAILQRAPQVGLRDYIDQLLSLGTITSLADAEGFLQQYEYARFSTRALTERQFEGLMASFATLLSGMTLDLARIEAELRENAEEQDDVDGDAEADRTSISGRSLSTLSASRATSYLMPGAGGAADRGSASSVYSANAADVALQQMSTYEPDSSTTSSSASVRSVIVQPRRP